MSNLLPIILLSIIIISCLSTKFKKKELDEITVFLDNYEIITIDLVDKAIISFKVTLLTEEEAKLKNIDKKKAWKTTKAEYNEALDKRNEMAKLWITKYQEFASHEQKKRKEEIDNKTQDIAVDGVRFSINWDCLAVLSQITVHSNNVARLLVILLHGEERI